MCVGVSHVCGCVTCVSLDKSSKTTNETAVIAAIESATKKRLLEQYGNDPVEIAKQDISLLHVPVLYVKPENYLEPGWGQRVLEQLASTLANDPASLSAQTFTKYISDNEDDIQKRLETMLETMQSRRAYFFQDAQETEKELEALGFGTSEIQVAKEGAEEVVSEIASFTQRQKEVENEEQHEVNGVLKDNNIV
eukprot:Blabericola_migrator_1__5924@NODE_299_length_10197_cov_100_341955_g246_i0_p5_GENE_NODE_299_length_10197_cov_100_341955_g246_i0NODE_299_length_10197_cov_100_341955_g246_i0_p5_ORF_typecomplete_len194_score55_26MutL_C/PF08676_11/0_069MutL_C/PF08676_11/8e02PqqD/PF05402_12/91PqqD/PF05402_12/7_8DHC/PF09626_10/0_2140S_SA_C/PF16122_5/1_4e0440S_SA_C/PF16122_5/1_3_NODE_299_length_10197_cov_100_341955_g246_i090669647